MTGIDVLGNSAITTPGGIIIAVLIYVANQYFRNRQETRADAEAARGTESGIVETSKVALAAVREQVDAMREDALLDRKRSRQRESEMQNELDELRARLERAEDDNRKLRQQLRLAATSLFEREPIRGDPAVDGSRPTAALGLAGGDRRRPDPSESEDSGAGFRPRRHRYRDSGGTGQTG